MPTNVNYELRGRIAWLTMDDGKANALSPALIDAVQESLTRAESEAAAVVIAGRPGRFCAGYDLQVMMSGKVPASDLVASGADMMARLYCLPLPVVVACTGHAMAGGALMLLCGDRRIGVKGAFKIGLNEVKIGIPLPSFGLDLVRDRLDPRVITAATMCAQIFDPEAALQAGFLDDLATSDELEHRAQLEAEALAELSRGAFAKTKLGLRGATAERMKSEVRANLEQLLG